MSYDDVVAANIRLHTHMAGQYSSVEPHFRPENVARVEQRLRGAIGDTQVRRMLDLGCGTGFMIQIGKSFASEIHGVDATPAMLAQVDRSGPATVTLHEADTGRFEVEPGSFQLVTAYSFLHHLFDIGPTLKTAVTALAPGGRFFAALEPNADFWSAIETLEGTTGTYDPIIEREIRAVRHRDEEIQAQFGVSAADFNRAEWGKTATGGFTAETLGDALRDAGFSTAEFFYEWFVGQGQLINDPGLDPADREALAAAVDSQLQRALPLSRQLFKYIGFVATR